MDCESLEGISLYKRSEETVKKRKGKSFIITKKIDVFSLGEEISRLNYDPAKALVLFATEEAFDPKIRLKAAEFIAERMFPVPKAIDNSDQNSKGVALNIFLADQKEKPLKTIDSSEVEPEDNPQVTPPGKFNVFEHIKKKTSE